MAPEVVVRDVHTSLQFNMLFDQLPVFTSITSTEFLELIPPCFGRFENKGEINWGPQSPEEFFGAFDGFSLKFLAFSSAKTQFWQRKMCFYKRKTSKFSACGGLWGII